MGAAHGFMQGRDLIVKSVAAFIKAPQTIAQAFLEQLSVDLRLLFLCCSAQNDFSVIKQLAAITVSTSDKDESGIFTDADIFIQCQRTRKHLQ